MTQNTKTPADIQIEADKKYPNTGYKDEIYCDIGHRDRGIYIQGRMDERANSWSDEDMLEALRSAVFSKEQAYNWLEKYKNK